jgi:hypothetical protein
MSAILNLTTTDGQQLAQVTVPTSLSEVTLCQWITFISPGASQADSVMTGLAPEVLDTLSEADRNQILGLLLFLIDAGMLRELQPTQGLYEVGNCAYGLYGQAQKYFAAHPELTRLAQGAYLYALYRNPTGSTMPEKELAAAHAAVLAAPVTDVIADCYHFVASFEYYHTGGRPKPGPKQPSLMRIAGIDSAAEWDKAHAPAPKPTGWLAKLGLGNLWNPDKQAVA